MTNRKTAMPVLFAVFLIAICGIIYELIIGALSSYLLGDSVKQYSITIGLFMSAMGIGSSLSKKIEKDLFDKFILIEILLAIVGGFSALILFISFTYTNLYYLAKYSCVLIIGCLVGLEIPILTRIIEQRESNLKENIADVMSFDYIGGLLGAVVFPMILLPSLGYMKTSFFVGLINISVALMLIFFYKDEIRNILKLKVLGFGILGLLIVSMIFGDQIYFSIEDNMYRDYIVLREQTQYQRIVATKHKDDYRLFLDGNLQFCSKDEYRYHESLVHPAMALAEKKDRILILGGGDGLAVRELLKYDDIKEITLVDIDQEMIDICTEDNYIAHLNEDAFKSEKLDVVIMDAYIFLNENQEKFDVIISDLPDPNNEALNKLYTNIFYRMIYNNLTDDGVLVVQSTTPLMATNAFWCINHTMASEGFVVKPYALEVPSFGRWGFNMAKKEDFDIEEIQVIDGLKYLDTDLAKAQFVLGKDESEPSHLKINSINEPVLIDYYLRAVREL